MAIAVAIGVGIGNYPLVVDLGVEPPEEEAPAMQFDSATNSQLLAVLEDF